MDAVLNIIVVEDHDTLREMTVEALCEQGHHAIGVDSAETLPDWVGMPPDVISTMSNLKPKEQRTITPSNAKRLGFGSFNFYGTTDPPATPQCSWDGFIVNGP